MSDSFNRSETASSSAGVQPAVSSAAAMARRRMLLKGLGKGSAVVAAAVPLQTLAVTTLVRDGKICSISGMQSGVHSRAPTTDVCNGYSPGKYQQGRDKWPTGVNPDAFITTICSKSTLQTYVCKEGDKVTRGRDAVRGKDVTCAAPVTSTLFDVMDFHQNTDEYHWVCAWLNAMGGPPGSAIKFPYSPAEVIGFYNKGKGTTEYNNALAFFKAYMENL